jgi:restriction system protein
LSAPRARHGQGRLLTTDKFTGPARDYARSIKKRIILIDGPELARLMVQFGVGVTVLRQLRITRLDSDYFDQEDV